MIETEYVLVIVIGMEVFWWQMDQMRGWRIWTLGAQFGWVTSCRVQTPNYNEGY